MWNVSSILITSCNIQPVVIRTDVWKESIKIVLHISKVGSVKKEGKMITTVHLASQMKVSVALIEKIAEHEGIKLKDYKQPYNAILGEKAITKDEADHIRFFMLHNREELHQIRKNDVKENTFDR